MSSVIMKSQNTKSVKVPLGNMLVRTVTKSNRIEIAEQKELSVKELAEINNTDDIICSNRDLLKYRCELLSGQWLDYWELYHFVVLPVIRRHATNQTTSRAITKFNSIHLGMASADSITCLNHFINSCQREYPLSKFLWDWFANPKKQTKLQSTGLQTKLQTNEKQFDNLKKEYADQVEYFFNSRISLEDLAGIHNKAKLRFEVDSRGISLYVAVAINQFEALYYLLHSIHVMEDGGCVIIQTAPCQLIEYIYLFGLYFETLKVHKSSVTAASFYIIGDKFLGNFNAKLIANKTSMVTVDKYFTEAQSYVPNAYDLDAILKSFTEQLAKEELIPAVNYSSEQYQSFAENLETEYDAYTYERAKFLLDCSPDKTKYITDKLRVWVKEFNLQPNNPKGILYALDSNNF